MYGHAVVVDGAVQPSLTDDRPSRLTSARGLKAPEVRDLRGQVDDGVVDGGCWFITVWRDGAPAQALFYGGLEGADPLTAFVKQLMPAAPQQDLPGRE